MLELRGAFEPLHQLATISSTLIIAYIDQERYEKNVHFRYDSVTRTRGKNS